MAPRAKSDASVSTIDGFVGSKKASVGAVVNLLFSSAKASSASVVQAHSFPSPLVSSVRIVSDEASVEVSEAKKLLDFHQGLG